MSVPFLDLRTQYQSLKNEILPEIEALMSQAAFVGGPALREFEEDFAKYCGAAYAVGVGNGTDALQIAFRAAGIGEGDEVITAANTFVATAEAIVLAGARPVLVDMDPRSYHLDVAKLEEAISPRTKAIVPVHLYGDPVDMDPVLEIAERRGVMVIEDSAQAHGATYKGRTCGSMGALSGFSFYPGKNLGAYGDGGAVTTQSEELAQKIRQIGDHGSLKKYVHEVLGTNSRLDAIQAKILGIKLGHLDSWNEGRRRAAAGYRERLGAFEALQLPIEREGHLPVYHLYVIRSQKVAAIDAALKEAGIGFGYHYPKPVHLQPPFSQLGYTLGDLPQAELGAEEILSLPMFPELTDSQLDQVCEVVGSAL